MSEDLTDGCPGIGRCHGCMSWCDYCGDVAGICDGDVCWQHRCVDCAKLLDHDEREMAFALGGRPAHCFACYPKSEAARELANGLDEMPALERAADFIAQFRRSA